MDLISYCWVETKMVCWCKAGGFLNTHNACDNLIKCLNDRPRGWLHSQSWHSISCTMSCEKHQGIRSLWTKCETAEAGLTLAARGVTRERLRENHANNFSPPSAPSPRSASYHFLRTHYAFKHCDWAWGCPGMFWTISLLQINELSFWIIYELLAPNPTSKHWFSLSAW